MGRGKKSEETWSITDWGQRAREGVFIVVVAISAYLLLSLGSYHPTDPSWSQQFAGQAATHIANAGGRSGAWVADVLLFTMG